VVKRSSGERSDLVTTVDADDLTGDPATVIAREQQSHACEFRSVKDSMLKAVGSRTFLLNLNSGAASSCDALEINE
jgi:hypothetical protein